MYKSKMFVDELLLSIISKTYSFTSEISFTNLMSVSATGVTSFLTLLDPRIQSTRDLINEKFTFVRTKHIVSLTFRFFFSANFSASFL